MCEHTMVFVFFQKSTLTFIIKKLNINSIDIQSNDQIIIIFHMYPAYLTKKKYANELSWKTFYESNRKLQELSYHTSWHAMMASLLKNKKYELLNEKIKQRVKTNPGLKIYPLPEYVLSAFSVTRADEVKVVFIGQDPYFNCEKESDKYVPQAMGLSFSIPDGISIPSSLMNIFENMVKYNHLPKDALTDPEKKKKLSGNLWYWAAQGCLMLNAALTVEDGEKKSHTKIWEWFTDYVIEYISEYMDGIIFVLWGGDAYEKINKIDLDKHHVIISSHPSGLSANKPFRNYPAFMNEDHFGRINTTLKWMGKQEIMWF